MRVGLLLLLLLPCVFGEIPPECPSAVCKCVKVGTHWTVNCQDKGLEQLPHFLKSYITWWVLDLSNNVIDRLNTGDFQPFRARTLKLNANGMVSIKKLALKNLSDSLKFLDLSDNNFHQVGSIEEGAFDELTSLTTIHLQNNVVKSLPSAPTLESLTLDANTLKMFPEFVYKYSKLQSLSLKANAIEALPDEVFNELRELNNLDLSYNNIKSVNACMILPHKMKALYLDYNPDLQCDCNLFWLDNANIQLSTNETGLNFLCPDASFSCPDPLKYCNLTPTDIPPRGSANTQSRLSYWTAFIYFLFCIYISKYHVMLNV